MREIDRLHGIPKEIVSNKDTKFTSNFWRGLFKGFGTNMNFNTTYHLLALRVTLRLRQDKPITHQKGF
jgi:hypothetical protein